MALLWLDLMWCYPYGPPHYFVKLLLPKFQANVQAKARQVSTLFLELKLKVKSEGNSVGLSLLVTSLHFYQ